MGGWGSSVTLEVSVAFTTDPLDAPAWTDITAYVKTIDIDWGRARELGPFQMGTLTLRLDNTDRRFDPLHATGPYYGNLVPNKQVRVRATYSATTYDLFYGFVDGWPQNYNPPADAEVVVTAGDAFKMLAAMPLPTSVYEVEVMADSPWGWWRFLDETGGQWTDYSGNDHHARLEEWVFGAYGSSLRTVADTKFGPNLLYEGGRSVQQVTAAASLPAGITAPISIEFWFRGRITFGAAAVIPVPWSPDASAGGLIELVGGKIRWWFSGGTNYVTTTNVCVPNDTLCHVVLTKTGGTVHIYVNGVDQALTTTGSVTFLDSGVQRLVAAYEEVSTGSIKTYDEFFTAELAVYDQVLSAARVSAHYAAGVEPWDGDDAGTRLGSLLDTVSWPTGATWRNLDTGETLLGPARLEARMALDICHRAEASEQGLFYVDHRDGGKVRFESRHNRFTATRSTASQYTFSDNAAATYHYEDIGLTYDERDVVNVIRVKWVSGTVEVTDATSITAYGRRALDVDTELPSAADAQALAEWVLARYKDPVVRCKTVTINPAVHGALFAPALGAKVSDRVTVRRLPQNTGAAIEKDVLIEGIKHHIDNGVNTWRTTFRCSEADSTAYWVWGTSTWGETTTWGW